MVNVVEPAPIVIYSVEVVVVPFWVLVFVLEIMLVVVLDSFTVGVVAVTDKIVVKVNFRDVVRTFGDDVMVTVVSDFVDAILDTTFGVTVEVLRSYSVVVST